MTKELVWRRDQESKSLFMLQKVTEWGLEGMLGSLSRIDGNQYEWRQDELGIEQGAWNKIVHSEIQPIMVFAHPAIIQGDTRRFMYYRHIAMISQKSMSGMGLQIGKLEEAPARSADGGELLKRCEVINGITSNLVLRMDTVTLKKIIICLGMGAGTQAGGSWHNAKGREVERAVWEKIKARAKSNGLRIEEIGDDAFVHGGTCYKLASDPDIGAYRDGRLIASVEIKGGIDPAAALERGGAVQKSCSRKGAQTRVCVARATAVTVEFERLMRSSGITLFKYEELDDRLGDLLGLLCLERNESPPY